MQKKKGSQKEPLDEYTLLLRSLKKNIQDRNVRFDHLLRQRLISFMVLNKGLFSEFLVSEEKIINYWRDGVIEPRMVEAYLKVLTYSYPCNGLFELDLVADYLQRPVAILSKEGDKFQVNSLSGTAYLSSMVKPLFLFTKGSNFELIG